jgi:hypothetical protein
MEIDKLEDGVWYDPDGGAFCTFRIDNDTVRFYNPDGTDEYHRENIETFDEDFIKVKPQAIEDPTSYVREKIGILASGDKTAATNMSVQEELSLSFALDYVNIVEESALENVREWSAN